MIKDERRGRILEQLQQKRMVKVADLIDEYNVSIETVRRDLEYLEKRGHLKRVYGGAVMHGLYGEEPSFEHREVINYKEKRAIGYKTAELIKDGDTVFIEVGTTSREVAKFLTGKSNLTVITTALNIAQILLENGNCRVIMLGGEVRPGEMATSGHMAEHNLQQFYANKAIIGVGGISLSCGITDYNLPESAIRRIMIERADTIIAVADYSKFDVIAMNNICEINAIDVLVVDWSVHSKTIQEFQSAGVDVVVAQPISE